MVGNKSAINRNTLIDGVQLPHLQMAAYSAYYVASKASGPTDKPLSNSNADIDGRATNVNNMTGRMQEYFSRPDSPMIVLDDSNRWMERNGHKDLKDQKKEIGNGYFVTLYDKASGKIIIAMPGLENDTPGSHVSMKFNGKAAKPAESLASRFGGDIGDVAFNVPEGLAGATQLRQTKALNSYLEQLGNDLRSGHISIIDKGKVKTLHFADDIKNHVVLAGHSAGTIPAMVMTGMRGIPSYLVEPRAYDPAQEKRMLKDIEYISGKKMDVTTFRASLDKNVTNLRASSPNIWNSNMFGDGEFKSETHGRNLVLHVKGANEGDNTIFGAHRIEVSGPAIINAPEAKSFPKEGSVIIDNAVPGKAARDFGEAQLNQAAPAAPAAVLAHTPAVAPS